MEFRTQATTANFIVIPVLLLMSGCQNGPLAPSLAGTWDPGDSQSGFHVASIEIDADEFPCDGSVVTQVGRGQMFVMDVKWHMEDSQVVGVQAEGDDIEIARVWLDGSTLSGEVNSLIEVGGKKELSFVGFVKQE